MIRRAGVLVAALVTALGASAPQTAAQILEGRPITIVVPFPPGASSDTLMRLVTNTLNSNTGQVFVIENKAGAGGAIASTMVKQATPDGHTLLQANAGSHAINPALFSALGYDPVKDFAPITLMWNFPSLLVVPASSPAKSVLELIAYAMTKSAGLNFGSQGSGSGGHILGEILKTKTGAPLVHVPFRGAAPAVVDLVAGRIDLLFSSYASVATFVQSGKLRALAVTGNNRLKALPNIPTMAEAGVAGVDLDVWFGLVAPAGTPKPVIDKLHTAFVAVLRSPAIVTQMEDLGIEAVTSTPAEFAALIAADGKRLADVVSAAGIKRQ
jgi:predicted outer membrane repeat protein